MNMTFIYTTDFWEQTFFALRAPPFGVWLTRSTLIALKSGVVAPHQWAARVNAKAVQATSDALHST